MGNGCTRWPLTAHRTSLERGCPPDMRFLPARTIPARRVTPAEERQFDLDCSTASPACRRPARVIGAFCIDATEVTAEQYARCVEAGLCTDAHLACGAAATYRHRERERLPINCVDYFQAASYCEALGRRLPAPEEYGWAQSSGAYDEEGQLVAPWGRRDPTALEVWASLGPLALEGPGPVTARPKGHSEQNVAGLFGNVREWSTPYRALDGTPRVAHLGYSYQTTSETRIRAGSKSPSDPESFDPATGFRCVAAPIPAQ